MRGELTVGAPLGDPRAPADRVGLNIVQPVLAGRFGIHPLQAFEDQRERMVDAGAGYSFESTATGFHHGAHATIAYHLWRRPFGRTMNWAARSDVHVTSDLFFARTGLGGGISVGTTLEWITFSTSDAYGSSGVDGTVIGVAQGEGGVGFTFDVAYRFIDGASYGVIRIGFVFRIPASVGIAFVPLL